MRLFALTAIALAAPPALAAQDGTVLDKVRAALNLPVSTNAAREWGVPDERVRTTIWDIHRAGVPAEDAARIFDEEVRIVREGGSKDNFGAFVNDRVKAGLRGRELSDAIHAEHARRGMGKPADPGKQGGKPADAGRPGQQPDGKPEAGERGRYPEDRVQEDQPQGQSKAKPNEGNGKGRRP
jgi:hypothetical protein